MLKSKRLPNWEAFLCMRRPLKIYLYNSILRLSMRHCNAHKCLFESNFCGTEAPLSHINALDLSLKSRSRLLRSKGWDFRYAILSFKIAISFERAAVLFWLTLHAVMKNIKMHFFIQKSLKISSGNKRIVCLWWFTIIEVTLYYDTLLNKF